jgi:hypothetical protein
MPLTREEIKVCRDAFDTFDKDGSGAVDLLELKQCLSGLGSTPSDEELGQMIQQVSIHPLASHVALSAVHVAPCGTRTQPSTSSLYVCTRVKLSARTGLPLRRTIPPVNLPRWVVVEAGAALLRSSTAVVRRTNPLSPKRSDPARVYEGY